MDVLLAVDTVAQPAPEQTPASRSEEASSLSASLKAGISELAAHIEQLGRSPMPSLEVKESERQFQLDMQSAERAYIDGIFTVNRVPYRVRLTSDFNHVAGRWELAENELIWRAENNQPCTPATRALIADKLDEWISPAVAQVLSGDGHQQALKAHLRSQLVGDLGEMKKALEDVENAEVRAADIQARARKHLGRLDETQQPSGLAELL